MEPAVFDATGIGERLAAEQSADASEWVSEELWVMVAAGEEDE